MNTIFIFKSLHIIGFVSWFAGIFYLVRMFVYFREASDQPEPARSILTDQFLTMQWRVYRIILNPAMMITWTAGILMLIIEPAYLKQGWIHSKLLLVVLLTVYHLYCKRIIRQFENGISKWDSFQLRLFNEVPTIFLVSIVFLAVYRDQISYLYLLLGLFLFGALIFFGARSYKRKREQSKSI